MWSATGITAGGEELRYLKFWLRAEAAGALRGAAEAAFAAAGARVFSGAFDALCGAETCDHRVPGTSTVAIVDRSHWTTEGSLYVAPFLACWLEGEGLLAS